jgi:hypothetical protein
MHTHTRAHTHIRTQTHTHIRTQTFTHTNKHTQDDVTQEVSGKEEGWAADELPQPSDEDRRVQAVVEVRAFFWLGFHRCCQRDKDW